ncbi:Small subunit (SSU) processome component [Komagataella phaffii CBS 7435]|uniref:U3 small nucleolar RNA-associated protein n=2 Tax=Komagataella phaffii TaxID=460519 RepID=C4QVT4_KOMPG|nr:U3 small nucleolar RNA-associated protein [Komagataella phaffii GS115]AOA61564.1 GQ67_02560T0 [Komagataella phaffii]CAH2446016.1 Small subunit (SSU) processome component [Komagataella phaffii CBS 7435]AOA66772.1 GQ68_02688T0 [Komagataella phaffii GS115]CAY67357.1 U3 small nucleolar RNA-associated protein [Komagataella phaffii GS115]CCA36457.1 Small subunit (SSU) processome component [Komagataella phaffii CBS 7435]
MPVPVNSSLKKRKSERKAEAVRPSKIFSPFRVLGKVSNEIPFAIGTLGHTFYIVTSVDRAFQIYDANTLHLLFVSNTQTPSKINALAAHFHYVYAAWDNKIGIYRRGILEHVLSCETENFIQQILVFGDFVICTTFTSNEIFVFKKKDSKDSYATEFYTRLSVNSLQGKIVGIVHPATYLNKIVVATTNSLLVFNIKTGKLLFTSSDFNEFNITSIETVPVLDLIAFGTSDGQVVLYNIKKGKRFRKIRTGIISKVTSVSFRTDGAPHFVASFVNGDLFFYDLEHKARVHILQTVHKEDHGGVSKAAFLNGQPIFVTNGGDNMLKEYAFDPNLSTTNSSIVPAPHYLRSRGGHSAPPTTVQFADPNSHFMLSASKDRSLWMFSLRKDAQAQEMSQRPPKKSANNKRIGVIPSMKDKLPEIVCLAQSNSKEGDWENTITGHAGETIARTWDTYNRRLGRWDLPTTDGGQVKSVAISACGNFGFVGSSSGGIGVYNMQSGIQRKLYRLHKKAVTGVAVDSMNRKMVSCGLDGIVGFYDFNESKYLGKLQLDAPITQLVYHHSSDLVALVLDDLSIVVVDSVTQKVVRVLLGHTNRITALDFTPNGRWIISSALDNTIRTWDLPTGSCIDGIFVPSTVTSLKMSPTGDTLATTHVNSVGIALWTNRAMFHAVSSRHVEESEFSKIMLPNTTNDTQTTIIEGAFDENTVDDNEITGVYNTVDQINEKLVTLGIGPRSKFNTLLHLDVIKQRNKPTEAPKKPENVPFFLELKGEKVGDRAIESEGKLDPNGTATQESGTEAQSQLNSLRGDNRMTFENEFTKNLRLSSETKEYAEFLKYVHSLSPSQVDLEIRSLDITESVKEVSCFIEALTQGLENNDNFDLIQAYMSMLMKCHGDIIFDSSDEELKTALRGWESINESKKANMDSLVKYCSGVINFFHTV